MLEVAVEVQYSSTKSCAEGRGGEELSDIVQVKRRGERGERVEVGVSLPPHPPLGFASSTAGSCLLQQQ